MIKGNSGSNSMSKAVAPLIPTDRNQSPHEQPVVSRNFRINCAADKKTLNNKNYKTADELKKDICSLYADAKFTDDNAIITYLNQKNAEKVLEDLSELPEQCQHQDLYIIFV